MHGREQQVETTHWSRSGVLRAAAAGAAVIAGARMGAARDGGLFAAPSADMDAEILARFIQLEQVQQAFYRDALRASRLSGDIVTFAEVAGKQESQHVALLTERLGGGARQAPRSDFGEALSTPQRFLETAIWLEEATISAYIAQCANLTRGAFATVVPMLSVEARQVAWARDLAGTTPAPRAADPGHDPDAVLGDLRDRGLIR